MPAVDGNLAKAFLSGEWRDWNAVQGNLDGTWRLASDVFVKQGDIWKKVWVRLTGPTGGSSSISHVTATISWTAGVGQEGFKLYRDGVFVKNVTSGTSTTDVVPNMYQNYVYSVSAYAGATETAQISCGTVQATIGSTTSSVSLVTGWQYVNDSWNNNPIVFNHSCTPIDNIVTFQYSNNGGSTVGGTFDARTYNFQMLPDQSSQKTFRGIFVHNGVTYFGPWSNVVNVYAGKPQVRTQETQDIAFDAWADQERYYTVFGAFDRLDTGYLAANILVDSYQFRNLSVNFASQITSSTRTIEISKPGTNITLGPSGINNGYNSSVFTNYADQRFRVDPQGTGWFNFNNANKLSGVIRFVVRPVTQTAVAYTIG